MWPFSKRQTLADFGLFDKFTEHHCHILPGVDDGIKTMEDALALLSVYENCGIRQIWLTPHIMEDVPNETHNLQKRFEELKANYKGNIKLRLAAENMLDNLFEERLSNNDLLPMGNNKDYLLVETSYFNPPMDMYETLESIKSHGYHPILAHPERYMYMDLKEYKRLKETGILFQLNMPSLAGMYGKTVQKKAEQLLKLGYYNLSGTDTHRITQFEHLAKVAKFKQDHLNNISSWFNPDLDTLTMD